MQSSNRWIINESPDWYSVIPNPYYEATFVSNGITYSSIHSPDPDDGFYDDTRVYHIPRGWANQAYRTVAFETAPTGDLRAWLEANAVKQ